MRNWKYSQISDSKKQTNKQTKNSTVFDNIYKITSVETNNCLQYFA